MLSSKGGVYLWAGAHGPPLLMRFLELVLALHAYNFVQSGSILRHEIPLQQNVVYAVT